MSGDDDIFVQYRPNRRRWLTIAAGLGAVLLLLVVLYSIRLTVFTPDAAVRAHFQGLADRDLSAALAVTEDGGGNTGPDLLDPAVLRSDQYTPPSDLELTEVTVDGRSAEVQVSFTVSERQHQATLRLRRDDGAMDRLFHRWRIQDAVRPLRLGETPGEISVNEVTVLAQDLAGAMTLPAVFGGYQVGVPPGDPLWDSRTVAIVVGPQQSTPVDVPMMARPEVREEVERQLTAILDECAASTELLPAGCPFGNARIGEAENVQWRITTYPRIAFSAGPDGFGGVAMLVHSTTDGEAVVTGVQLAFSLERPFETEVPFPVSGIVTSQGETVQFEPSW